MDGCVRMKYYNQFDMRVILTPLNVEDILQEKDDDDFNNDQDEDEVFDNNLDSDDEMSE